MSLLHIVTICEPCLKSTMINNVALFTNISLNKTNIFPPLKHQRNPPWITWGTSTSMSWCSVSSAASRRSTRTPNSPRAGRGSFFGWAMGGSKFCRVLPQKQLRSYDPYRKGSGCYISCFIRPYNYYDWIYPLQPPVHELMFTKLYFR